MSARSRRKTAIHTDMTPMVDVMMLLVIFFMMSTAFVAVSGFDVTLPQASIGETQNEKIIVFVGKEGQIAIDGNLVTKNQLASALKNFNDSKTSVSIRADKEARHGLVVEIMDEIRKNGITKMTIAIEQKGP